MGRCHALLSRLNEVSAFHDGYLTIRQMRHAGVGDNDIARLCAHGDLRRVRTGMYRLTGLPPSPRDPYVEAMLWPTVRTPQSPGTISHASAR